MSSLTFAMLQLLHQIQIAFTMLSHSHCPYPVVRPSVAAAAARPLSSASVSANPCNMCCLYVSRSDHFHIMSKHRASRQFAILIRRRAPLRIGRLARTLINTRLLSCNFPLALIGPMCVGESRWKKSLIGGLESVLNGVARRMQSVLDPIINYGECLSTLHRKRPERFKCN